MPAGRRKVPGLGFHKNLGQYRKVINGRSIYFGSDPDEALARYGLFLETGLLWKRGYRQYCLQQDGKVIPFGATMDIARRNFNAFAAKAQQASHESVHPTDYVVDTVREVGDAYVEWLIECKKNPSYASEVKHAFKELNAFSGDVPLEHLTPKYFKDWYRHCWKKVNDEGLQVNWANPRMRTVKAAFLRCRKENWFGVAVPDLDALVAVLQQHGGPQQEQEIFKPAELRSLLKTGELEDRAAILLGLNCAIGNMDMGRLRWKHFNRREIGEDIEYIYEQPRGKNQRKRRPPLWPLTVEILHKWKVEASSRGMAVGGDNYVFTTRDGTPVTLSGITQTGKVWHHRALAKRFTELLKKAGIKRPRLGWYSRSHVGHGLRGRRCPSGGREPVSTWTGIWHDVEDLQQGRAAVCTQSRRGDLARLERRRSTRAGPAFSVRRPEW